MGCVKCGSVVGYSTSSIFGGQCRGFCPSGSVRPIRLLAKGQHPRGTGVWPSGELMPNVYQLTTV